MVVGSVCRVVREVLHNCFVSVTTSVADVVVVVVVVVDIKQMVADQTNAPSIDCQVLPVEVMAILVTLKEQVL